MGDVRITIKVVNPASGKDVSELDVLVDTGATLPVIPQRVLESIGVSRTKTIKIRMADGRIAERDVGDATIIVNGDSATSRVVFGKEEDAPVIGLTILEQLGLAVDPIQRRLVPAEYLFYISFTTALSPSPVGIPMKNPFFIPKRSK